MLFALWALVLYFPCWEMEGGTFFVHFSLLPYSHLVQRPDANCWPFSLCFNRPPLSLSVPSRNPISPILSFMALIVTQMLWQRHRLSKPLWTPASDVSCHLNLEKMQRCGYNVKQWVMRGRIFLGYQNSWRHIDILFRSHTESIIHFSQNLNSHTA